MNLRAAQIFIGLVAGRAIGLDEPGLHQRLAMAGAQYGRDPFISKNHAAARLAVEEAEDRAFLEGIIAGTEDVLSEDTFPKLEPMFTCYPEGSDMFKLLEQAAEVFGDAVQDVAAWALAGAAIDQAQHGMSSE
jgi:hypothetical protein